MGFEDFTDIGPYSFSVEEKNRILTKRLCELTKLHRERCPEYSKMLETVGYEETDDLTGIPFLPVRLFKEMSLKSVPDSEVVKTMTSSGTTGQSVSRIYLDRVTSANQQKAMVKIVSEFTGKSRMPMIIIDCPSVIKDRAKFSARGAGILGFSMFGTKKIYALNDDMQLDVEGLSAFLSDHKDENILLFGFTFMIWQHFYKELVRLKEQGITFNLSNGILIHGGGWKKLISEAVSRDEFHRSLNDVCGLKRIHDYYGMVEQTGCIYMECECAHLHASVFSDVITRRLIDFKPCEVGEKGIIQVVSAIPESYPGHSLLTEDEGVIEGIDDCPCGRKGKYFSIIGRLKNAEIRGCSDTYAAGMTVVEKNSGDGDVYGRISFLTGDRNLLEDMIRVRPKQPFSDDIIEFLTALSKILMENRDAKAFPDVVTLGFWLRKASLMQLKRQHFDPKNASLVGRGMAFHIAPSNVPVNFAYSLFTGLICGNANVVRAPSKDFPQVGIINTAIREALEIHPEMKPYICLVRYERDKEINDLLSGMSDVRIIWGGDATIEEIRRSPLKPRAKEITFADRYSLAVIDSGKYLSIEDKDRVASDFYNDTYLSDQNACTSPRAVVWTGSKKEEAKSLFWEVAHKLALKKYTFQPVQGVDKLTNTYLAGVAYKGASLVKGEDNVLVRVKVPKLDPELMDYRGNSGFFYEYDCNDITDIRDFCDDTHCQTIGYIGDPQMFDPLPASGIKGVDRIVPVGHTMDFDLVWDGYDLVGELTRKVQVN